LQNEAPTHFSCIGGCGAKRLRPKRKHSIQSMLFWSCVVCRHKVIKHRTGKVQLHESDIHKHPLAVPQPSVVLVPLAVPEYSSKKDDRLYNNTDIIQFASSDTECRRICLERPSALAHTINIQSYFCISCEKLLPCILFSVSALKRSDLKCRECKSLPKCLVSSCTSGLGTRKPYYTKVHKIPDLPFAISAADAIESRSMYPPCANGCGTSRQ
jgi:hypothetical protein